MKLSFVIPNYNGEALLENNLPRVLGVLKKETETLNHTLEVIVVDDGSKDRSIEILEGLRDKEDSNLLIMRNVKNQGFSPTVNKGVAEAKGEIVILLNTDVLPKAGFLHPLLKHFVEEDVFAVGCLDESVEKGKIVLRGRGTGKWEKGFLMHARGEIDKSTTLWVSGGSGAFRKSLWDKLGGLCELYTPFYWEDIDLSYRAQKAGYRVVFEKESVVEHRHAEGAIQKSNTSGQIKIIAYRNQFFFVWLNITDLRLVFSHLFWLPYHLASALKSGDKAFLVGFANAVFQISKVLSYRRRNKSIFKRNDSEVLQNNR